ncbi:DUF4012 domain-containing protein [Nocardioides sp. BP30]|uniref:DUF4012 domain-containing protein n=1 Tax=Nocardioides sp. BP30 TaxID=3036374 RepID=UPI0024684894|nr:DUF4012 domain-containing protein [Nocardioides sp. BP30]WGL52057.1 DUF4012 domain-containing protein [Nocardioides sp. BP30]
MRVQHPWRWVSGTLGVVVVLVIAYAGWLLWDAAHNLKAAADDASALKTAALGDDPAQVTSASKRFSEHADSAADATDSPVWSLLTHLPVVGDDARGVRTVSRVGHDLAHHGLSELTDTVGDLDAVLPRNGGIDTARLQSMTGPVDDSYAALTRARTALAGEDPSGYMTSLKLRYRDLQSEVDDATDAMAVAHRALGVLPQMLGADGPRNYLLIMQNNAEIRATGGLPGAVSLLHVDHGRISMVREVSGASFGESPAPVLPIQPAEQKIFGGNIGRYFVDANLTPDFARSADLWKARWEQTQPEKIDGVVSLDTVTLSYLLRALGPVDVDGVQLTSDTVVDELLSKVYQRLPDPAAEDAFFAQVASTVFNRVTSFSGSKKDLLTALQQAADEHRILVHDFDGSVQSRLASTVVAGSLSTGDAQRDPQVGIYFADATLSKMSYYLRYDSHVAATSCVRGVQTLSGSLTLTSTAPKDARTTLPAYVTGQGLPKSSAGDMLVAVYVFAPSGGGTSKFADNDLDFPQFDAVLDGRKVIQTWVLLEPGKSKDLSWTMTSGAGQIGPTRVNVTPSVQAGAASAAVRSAC